MKYDTHDFMHDVIEHSHSTPVVVDFWAEWCAPCRMLGPVLERLAEQANGQWVLTKLNTEQYPEIAQQYGVQGIPNVKMFVDGEVASEFTGAMPEEMIVQWLSRSLPSHYRKHIQRAQTLLAEHKLPAARQLLQEVVEAEPENHQVTALLARTYIFTDAQKALELINHIREDSDYADQVEAIRIFGRLFQLLEQPETLEEHPVKVRYLAAIDNLHTEQFDKALDEFLEVVRRRRYYDDDGARKACIAIFKYLGENHEITQQYRRELGSALYV